MAKPDESKPLPARAPCGALFKQRKSTGLAGISASAGFVACGAAEAAGQHLSEDGRLLYPQQFTEQ